MTNFLTLLSVSHVVQAIIIGAVLAFLTAQLLMNAALNAMTTTVNGLYFWPRMTYSAFKRAVVRHGIGGEPVPVNTLYATPTLSSPAASNASVLGTGTDDVLYVGGWLDLSNGPLVLHVPDMAGRYYRSLSQFCVRLNSHHRERDEVLFSSR